MKQKKAYKSKKLNIKWEYSYPNAIQIINI